MKLQYTEHFSEGYQQLPEHIKKQSNKQLELLLKNFRHPSLYVKKIQGLKQNIWEARVSEGYRFTFQIERDVYLLRKIGTHDILRSP